MLVLLTPSESASAKIKPDTVPRKELRTKLPFLVSLALSLSEILKATLALVGLILWVCPSRRQHWTFLFLNGRCYP